MIRPPESPKRGSPERAPWTDLTRGPFPLFATGLLAVLLVATYAFGHPFGIGLAAVAPTPSARVAPTSAAARPTSVPTAAAAAALPATPIPATAYPAAATIAQPATPIAATAYPALPAANATTVAAVPSGTSVAGATACETQPVRGFGLLYTSQPTLASRLGCATGAEAGTSLTVQAYANGQTIDAPAQKTTYILTKDGKWTSQPDGANSATAAVAALGAPNGSAQNVGGAIESFQHGTLLWTPDKVIFALYADGGWDQHADTFVDATATPATGNPALAANPTPAATATPAPAAAVASCPNQPVRGFALVYTGQANVATRLGCASDKEVGFSASQQSFEHGLMIERSDTHQIFVIHSDGSWAVHPDTYQSGQPLPSVGTPPANLVAPVGPIGMVWGQHADVQKSLGWATGAAQDVSGAGQNFAGGQMLWTSAREIYVLYSDKTSVAFPDQFVDPAAN